VALGDFTTHEFEELQRLLIKMNSTLQATVEPGAGQPGAGQPAAGAQAAVPAEV